MRTLYKQDLIADTAERTGKYQYVTERVLNEALQVIADALLDRQEVMLIGFGKFYTETRKEQVHKFGSQEVVTPAHVVVKFKPSKLLSKYVNNGGR